MNPQDSLAQNFSEDLPWLAFLYVSEDLTPDEAADFEERLLTDQAAREAVAEAMTMAEGLWMASAMDSLTPKPESADAIALETRQTARRKSQRLSWLASSAALAGLAFFVGWWAAHQHVSPQKPAPSITHNPPQSPAPVPPIPVPRIVPELEGAGQLVEIWSDSQTLVAELLTDSPVAESAEEFLPRESAEPEEDTFAWMLAAVSTDRPEDANPQQPSAVMEN